MNRLKTFLLTNSTTKQTVAKNTFWLFFGEMLSRVLKLALVVYAARTLGSAGWGVFSYTLSTAALLMIFSDMGLTGLIIREVVQKKESYQVFISTALIVKAFFLVVSTILVTMGGQLIAHIPEAKPLFPIVAIVLFFDSLRDLTLGINTAFEKMERDTLVKTIMNVLVLVLGIILLRISLVPTSIAIAYAIGSAVGFFIALFVIRNDVRGLFTKGSRNLIRTVIATTWPFAVIGLIGTIMGNTDIYLLGIWRNASEIGLYASVQRIQQFIIIIPVMVATAVFPVLSRLANKDNQQFALVLERTLALIMLLGIPIAIGGAVLARPLVTLLFGGAYAGATVLLQILMITLLANLPLILLSNSVFAFNGQKNIAIAYLGGLVVNVLLNVLLIPRFGAAGSAFATAIATTIITAYIWRSLYRLHPFHVFRRLKGVLLVSLLTCIPFLVFEHLGVPVVINGIVSFGVYFAILFILREPLLHEIEAILRTKHTVL